MAITLRTNQIKLKDQNGNYSSPIVLGDSTIEEHIAEVEAAITSAGDEQIGVIETAGGSQVSAIVNKGAETLASIPDDYETLEDDVADLKNAIKSTDIVPLDGYRLDYGNMTSSGTWNYIASTFQVCAIPVEAGQEIKIRLYGAYNMLCAFVKSYTKPVDGESIDFSNAAGFTTRISIIANTDASFIVPSDAKYIIIEPINNGNNIKISQFEIDGYNILQSASKNIIDIENDGSQFRNDVAAMKETIVRYSTESPKIIQQDGSIISASSGVVTNEIDLSEFRKLKITTKVGYGNLACAFYASDDSFISGLASVSDGYSDYDNRIIDVPDGASYAVVAGANATRLQKIVGMGEWELDIAPTVIKQTTAYPVNSVFQSFDFTLTKQKIITASGSIADTSATSYNITGYVDVSGYDTVIVYASNNYGNALYAFYDSTNAVVKVGTVSANEGTNTVINGETIVVPANAKYICVAGREGSAATYIMADVKHFEKYAPGKWNGKKWCCVGDSLTEVSANARKKYFDYIHDETGITIVNMGVSGTGYARTRESNTAFYQRISNVPVDSDVITIFGSFNDLGAGLSLGDVDDTGTETLAGCINTTLDNLFTVLPLAIVGIVAPTPWDTANPLSEPNNASNYVDLLKSICARRSIPFLDLFHKSLLRPWDADFRALAYSRDSGSGTHPDETGHKIIAPRFEAFLDELLFH